MLEDLQLLSLSLDDPVFVCTRRSTKWENLSKSSEHLSSLLMMGKMIEFLGSSALSALSQLTIFFLLLLCIFLLSAESSRDYLNHLFQPSTKQQQQSLQNPFGVVVQKVK